MRQQNRLAVGWMMHMLTHMIDYMRWYNDNAEAEWVMGQAAGRGKLSDNHPSPDYIAGFIQFANGVHGLLEIGGGAPNIPEVKKWWGRNRIRVMGDDGFAEVLTNGGWRAVTAKGAESGEGAMNYDADMQPYVQEMADWLNDDGKVHSCNFDSAYKGFEIMMAICRSVVEGGQVARGEGDVVEGAGVALFRCRARRGPLRARQVHHRLLAQIEPKAGEAEGRPLAHP